MSRVLDGLGNSDSTPEEPDALRWDTSQELLFASERAAPAPRRVPFVAAAAVVALVGALGGFGAARVVTFARSTFDTDRTHVARHRAYATSASGSGHSVSAPASSSTDAHAAPGALDTAAVAASTQVPQEHAHKRAERHSEQVAPASMPSPDPPAIELAAVVAQDPAVAAAFTMPAPAELHESDLAADVPERGPTILDGGASVEVSADQLVNVSGSASSLRSLIEEICRQSGIELRTYTAPDRRYAGHLEKVPLADALRSILRSESYFVGLRYDDAPAREHMTWLKVLGTSTEDATASATPEGSRPATPPPPTLVTPAATGPTPPARRLALPASLLFEAFGTMDADRRKEAQDELLHTLAVPQRREQFLSTDAAEIAKIIARYQHSAEAIRRLRDMAEGTEMQTKLDEVLGFLSGDKGSTD